MTADLHCLPVTAETRGVSLARRTGRGREGETSAISQSESIMRLEKPRVPSGSEGSGGGCARGRQSTITSFLGPVFRCCRSQSTIGSLLMEVSIPACAVGRGQGACDGILMNRQHPTDAGCFLPGLLLLLFSSGVLPPKAGWHAVGWGAVGWDAMVETGLQTRFLLEEMELPTHLSRRGPPAGPKTPGS